MGFIPSPPKKKSNMLCHDSLLVYALSISIGHVLTKPLLWLQTPMERGNFGNYFGFENFVGFNVPALTSFKNQNTITNTILLLTNFV